MPPAATADVYRCLACNTRQPLNFTGWICPACGGLLDLSEPIRFDLGRINQQDHTLWRYRHTFPLPAEAKAVTLGEGLTPLVSATVDGRSVHFKLEFTNPTGSFKDRGMTLVLTAIRAIGITAALEDSSGNAGASFAAYAARAKVKASVYVPASASGPKLAQIASYGADIRAIDGPRSNAATAAQQAAAGGLYYASHVYNPLGLAGQATAAFEIWEQLGRLPESVVLPVGNGTLLLGLQRGFQALVAAGLGSRLPRLVGVQALACAPLWAQHQHGLEGLAQVTEGATLAEGIRVLRPARAEAILAAIRESGGTLLAVDEPAIEAGRAELARLGLYAELTSGIVWEALKHVPGEAVAILTGSGLKNAR
jgi:threonine synthase